MAGRPRSFDRDVALDLALHTFWERGYQATSVAQLTETMGIAPPSLYAAFGDKRRLFDEAARRYVARLEAALREHLAAPTAREAMERMLRGAVDSYTDGDTPGGCLVMSEPLLDETRRWTREELRGRFERGRREGDVPPDADPAGLADYVDVVLAGLSARSRDGVGRESLMGCVDRAVAALPGAAA